MQITAVGVKLEGNEPISTHCPFGKAAGMTAETTTNEAETHMINAFFRILTTSKFKHQASSSPIFAKRADQDSFSYRTLTWRSFAGKESKMRGELILVDGYQATR